MLCFHLEVIFLILFIGFLVAKIFLLVILKNPFVTAKYVINILIVFQILVNVPSVFFGFQFPFIFALSLESYRCHVTFFCAIFVSTSIVMLLASQFFYQIYMETFTVKDVMWQ